LLSRKLGRTHNDVVDTDVLVLAQITMATFKMRKNLHVVSSPLQLMNCIEAIHHFSLSQNILILYVDNLSCKTLPQLEYISKKEQWESVIYIKRPLKRLSYYLFPILIFIRLKRLKNRTDYIFAGYPDYFITHLINYIGAKEVFFVDDGVASLFLIKQKN
jgi:hypothetical protein